MAKLEEYQRKRRFDRTPEPSGEAEPTTGKLQDQPSPAAKRTRLPKPKLPQLEVRPGAEHGDTFVVQKHRATRLHYDLAGDRWNAEVVGRAQGTFPEPRRQAAGGANGRSSAGLRQLRR